MRMDVTELQDFIDSFDLQDEKLETRMVREKNRHDKCVDDVEVERRHDDILQSIYDAAYIWLKSIVDAECLQARSRDFRYDVEKSLYRQQLDGFLSTHDVVELRYTNDLWVVLLNTLTSYLNGCVFLKRNILSSMLKLYSIKQITEELFIDTCLNL